MQNVRRGPRSKRKSVEQLEVTHGDERREHKQRAAEVGDQAERCHGADRHCKQHGAWQQDECFAAMCASGAQRHCK